MKKNAIACVLSLLLITLFCIAILGVFPTNAALVGISDQAIYEHDYQRIESFRSVHNLALLKATCDNLFLKWKATNPDHFVDLSCEACEVLNSINFHDPKQFALAETYALNALSDSVSKSVNQQSCLVLYGLSNSYTTSPGGSKDWGIRRKEVAGWWFSTWQRIDQNVILNFNPADYPYALNVPPPLHLKQTFFSGMSAANIHDPKMRHQYEKAIAKNIKNASIVKEQRDLQELKQTFDTIAKQRIVALYSSEPYEPEELNSFLNTYVNDKTSKQEIVEAIKTGQNTHQ